jgi:hypothetical protein
MAETSEKTKGLLKLLDHALAGDEHVQDAALRSIGLSIHDDFELAVRVLLAWGIRLKVVPIEEEA